MQAKASQLTHFSTNPNDSWLAGWIGKNGLKRV